MVNHCLYRFTGRSAGLFLLLLLLLSGRAGAQLSSGGSPRMPDLRFIEQSGALLDVAAPDVHALQLEDNQRAIAGNPERMGVNLPVNITVRNSGAVVLQNGSQHTWALQIRSKGAVGLGLYFSSYHLPEGAQLFVYSADGKQLAGAFTSRNNQPDGRFAVEVIRGDRLVVEYTAPGDAPEELPFRIAEVLYVYTPMYFPGQLTEAARAGSCEVNTACSEGDNWRNQIKSVVRILVKNGGSSYWCTGVVMNNTAADFEPFVLTADHCARNYADVYASAADLSQWIFYFAFETPGCENTSVTGDKTLTGAVKRSSSSPVLNDGSDFYLVSLNDPIPASYDPYYAGWNISGAMSPSGVGIHHPAGDVKKISTYTQTLTESQWGQVSGTHYRVFWSATENGHGVTEGGSSGSPLFDNQGFVIGQLTGGDSDCSSVDSPDYYGRMSWSWQSNGSSDTVQLKPWLDPLDLGISSLGGAYNTDMALARFDADTTIVPIGSSVVFHDLSTGWPVSWHWEFEGGKPETSDLQEPGAVVYDRLGMFNVKLVVSNAFGSDSLVRENFIRVRPVLYPNPATDEVTLLLGDHTGDPNKLVITNALGRIVYQNDAFCPGQRNCSIDVSRFQAGFYLVTFSNAGYSETDKLLIVRY